MSLAIDYFFSTYPRDDPRLTGELVRIITSTNPIIKPTTLKKAVDLTMCLHLKDIRETSGLHFGTHSTKSSFLGASSLKEQTDLIFYAELFHDTLEEPLKSARTKGQARMIISGVMDQIYNTLRGYRYVNEALYLVYSHTHGINEYDPDGTIIESITKKMNIPFHDNGSLELGGFLQDGKHLVEIFDTIVNFRTVHLLPSKKGKSAKERHYKFLIEKECLISVAEKLDGLGILNINLGGYFKDKFNEVRDRINKKYLISH